MFGIAILNYNNYKTTEKCINSILLSDIDEQFEIVILDNGSNNDSYDILKDEYATANNISVIKQDVNLGFGGAITLSLIIS